MPTTRTTRAGDKAKAAVKERVKSEGFGSLYAMCREKRVDYQLARRAVLEGLHEKTTLGTILELARLGILDLVPMPEAGPVAELVSLGVLDLSAKRSA